MVYRLAFPALWIGWAVYWALAAREAKPNARRETQWGRLAHGLPLALCVVLFELPRPAGSVWSRRLPVDWRLAFWAGFLLAVAGIAFAVWARRYLAGNWSADVTVKQGHELITSGPYRFVRHPIYSGMLLAILGSALARSDALAGLALLVAVAALLGKSRKEERWMAGRFGAEYAAYRRRVAALVPGIY